MGDEKGEKMPGIITLYIALGGFCLWFIYLICQALYSIWRWIQDKEQKPVFLFQWKYGTYIDINIFKTFVSAIILFGVIILWKVAVPIGILFACAFGMRWAARFKKRVNTAIEKCKPNKKEVNGDKHIMGESGE